MPDTHASEPSPRQTWRLTGAWMVVLAIILAVLGMGLALQQARSLSMRAMVQAQNRAVDIAEKGRVQFEQQLRASLRRIAEDVQGQRRRRWVPPEDWLPWIDGVYLWDASTLWELMPPSNATADQLEIMRDRLTQLPVRPPSGNRLYEPDMLDDRTGDLSVVSTVMWAEDADGSPIVIIGCIDAVGVRAGLIEPLFAPNDRLELVPREDARRLDRPWGQSLFGPARAWLIQPTESFLQEQRFTVMGQTLAYLGLTILSLATLLVALWLVLRVARREMALAELKANFVADVSHELKTPLAVIQLYTETLQAGRVSSPEKRQEYYSIITHESERLTNLINNILDFARIEAGRKEYTLEPADVGQVIRETYETYRAHLDQCDFEHNLTVEGGLPPVDADGDAIAQVLINLMTNALKYSEDERYLGIEVGKDTRRGRRGVLISVHDRGIGIRPEERSNLTEGFYRASDTRVRQKGGTGLGLALVKHIVDIHNGSLDVESRLVKGSTFRVFLPASERQAGRDNEHNGGKPILT
ncbi:MAG: hypothetical protein JSU63_10680 [Phycisphaerales bacterium]|nr:MAG: hypothetical protein JSU63_10680 [Phycisphaerales bacterium]